MFAPGTPRAPNSLCYFSSTPIPTQGLERVAGLPESLCPSSERPHHHHLRHPLAPGQLAHARIVAPVMAPRVGCCSRGSPKPPPLLPPRYFTG